MICWWDWTTSLRSGTRRHHACARTEQDVRQVLNNSFDGFRWFMALFLCVPTLNGEAHRYFQLESTNNRIESTPETTT